jgi:hypothetical protein
VEEITIKVPAPFAGIADLGFTAQYPEQEPFAPTRDVPLVIEGPPRIMARLSARLRMLRDAEAKPHAWSDPVMLSDELVVMAFRDRSLEGRTLADGALGSLDYVVNLVRPVAFPFLQDCVQLADLRLSDRIEIRVQTAGRQIAEMEVRADEIVQPNGSVLLWELPGR